MKLLVDMFPCQTPSRFRGIGRYTLSLTREMAKLRGSNEMILLADALYPDSFEELRQEFIRLLPVGSFLPYFHESLASSSRKDFDSSSIIAETLIEQAYQSVSPDIVLTPSLFDAWGGGVHGLVPLPNKNYPNQMRSAILFDIIPYIFQKQYLDSNPKIKKWYLERIDSLKNFDLLLAISEATRQDAINILGIKPERVVNISGAASWHFRKLTLTEDNKQNCLNKFGISRPFVLYIGGNDFRKNMDGALCAFAKLPREISACHQLVLNDVGNEAVFWKNVHTLGLTEADVVVTGHTSDEELAKLYNLCKLFIFPSLYEGFGLPVLEAMSCDAPVIASNNSSLPEVVGWADAMFDATSERSITETLYRALTDDFFRQELRIRGQERAKLFSWNASAQRAWEAFESMQQAEIIERKNILVNSSRDKSRIAFVSPFPPQKSGIADYSNDLLPYLSRHFDIDLFAEPGLEVSDSYLRQNYAIYPWTELLPRRDDYETVVYQFGNSSFHAHMFELERQFKGVVVLHDFYLSHLIAHIGITRGSFQNELDNNHGLRSVVEYKLKGHDVVWDWPVNWQVLRNASELIVHSKYHNKLLERFWGRGWRPSPTIIPQLHSSSPAMSAQQRQAIREKLGISKDGFLFCAFGMLTPEKYNLLSIQAFGQFHQIFGNGAQLIFVGDIVGLQHQMEIKRLIEHLNLHNQVQITGYVSKEDYESYLISADVAIQLRTNSRGETSRAVLDCMSYGLPIIINAHATFDDYDDESVIKLPDLLGIDDLAKAMIRLKNDKPFRLEKGRNARKVIKEEHDPRRVAEAYTDVINRAIQIDDRRLFTPLLDLLGRQDKGKLDIEKNAGETEAKNAAANLSLRCQPRILIDVTYISNMDLKTGIQRVVKYLAREFFSLNDRSLQLEVVRLSEGQLLRSGRFVEELLNLPEQSLGPDSPVFIRPGDTLFMLDSSWEEYDQFLPVFEQVRQLGGKIATMVYDLIPIKYPEMVNKGVAEVFHDWMNIAIAQSDFMVCISRSVADELLAYINENQISPAHRLDIAYIHLGADFLSHETRGEIRSEYREFIQQKNNLFLVIGTLEARKRHSFILDAFEYLWSQGYDYYLCFAGKIGWKVEELEKRICTHPELGKRLLFVENPTDAEINTMYQSATALVFASIAEGFGLPIVEAALHKVPVIVSDIPVFREVGGDGALYFSLSSPVNLAKCVIEISQLSDEERVGMASKIKTLTWRMSAEWLRDVLDGKRGYITLPQTT
jgi:glycosyltransferase involved in cell wall biosynthesis